MHPLFKTVTAAVLLGGLASSPAVAQASIDVEQLRAMLIEGFEKAAGEAEAAQIEATVDQAINDGKLDKSKKEELVTAFAGNMPGLNTVLASLTTKAPNISAQLSGAEATPAEKVDAPASLNELQAKMTYRQLERKEPRKLKDLMASNPEYVAYLYQNQYGVSMAQA